MCPTRFPSPSGTHFADQETYALVVRRIEPEHPLEDALGLFEPTKAPATETEAVHAAQQWSVVDVPPRKQPVEMVTERQLANPKPDLVMTECNRWVMVELEVAEMRMGIEASQIRPTELHQD